MQNNHFGVGQLGFNGIHKFLVLNYYLGRLVYFYIICSQLYSNHTWGGVQLGEKFLGRINGESLFDAGLKIPTQPVRFDTIDKRVSNDQDTRFGRLLLLLWHGSQ